VTEQSIEPVPVGPLTRMVAALLSEASIYIARAPDPDAARAEIGVVLDRMLRGLARGGAATP
jgi:hypothetical protein